VEFIKIDLSWALLKANFITFCFGKELFNQFYFPSKATDYLAKLIPYNFGQATEFFCDLIRQLYRSFGLVLSLLVIIVTFGCIWLARLF